MRDELTCWDYVTEFNGQQAAIAIVGEPDTDDPAALRKAKPVLDRMRRAYEGTREHFADAPEGLSDWRLMSVYGDDVPPPERRLMSVDCDGATVPGGERLVSVEMVNAEARAAVGSTKTSEEHRHDPEGEEATRWRARTKAALFLDWLRSPMADFERQTFLRDELARWVQAMGASSLYLFADPAAQPIDAQSASAAPHLQAATTSDRSTPAREQAETEGLPDGLRAPLEPAAPDWIARVRTEAAAMRQRQRAGNMSPTVRSLSDDLAAWCRTANVTTRHAIFPSPEYIRKRALRGWQMPE